jgi:hypothetical protein
MDKLDDTAVWIVTMYGRNVHMKKFKIWFIMPHVAAFFSTEKEFESKTEAQRWADRSFSSLPFGSAWEVQEKKEE